MSTGEVRRFSSSGNLISERYSDGYEVKYDENTRKVTYRKYTNGDEVYYDSDGKLIRSKTRDGTETWCDYDSEGNFNVKSRYDVRGNLIYVRYDDEERWHTYDEEDNLIHTTNRKGYDVWYDKNGMEITKN